MPTDTAISCAVLLFSTPVVVPEKSASGKLQEFSVVGESAIRKK
jgi:hypothetical protein